MEELKRTLAETAGTVEAAEVRGAVKRTDHLKSRLEEVDALEADVGGKVDHPLKTTFSGPGCLRRQRQLGELLRDDQELKSRRQISTFRTVPGGKQEAFSLADSHLNDVAVANGEEGPVNIEAAATAGADPHPLAMMEETLLSKVRDLLAKDGDRVRLIGVRGSAGVGKTTILRKIRDEFRTGGSRGVFDMVVYASVSRRDSVRRLQQDLVAAMDLSVNVSSPQARKSAAELIRVALSEKRVLLLLDDVWEKLDLASAGLLPADESRNYNSQIVFATASPDICEAMGALETVMLGLLDENQSWELFRREAGGDAVLRDDSIGKLARQMARRCGGRPLALMTVGRAMAHKQLPVEWSHAARALQEMTEESTRHKGMDLETAPLFSPLKFSYDNLRDDKLRTCLLYCALFPACHDIDREQLVEYWMGEGLLDFGEPAGLYVARNRGQMIINSLQSACLLQSGSTDDERCVKLPEAVRDMAVWITNGKSDGEDRFLVNELKAEKWSTATRVSLMEEKVEKLPDKVPTCSKLSTLLINGCPTQQTPGPKLDECKISVSTGSFSTFLPESFFRFYPFLRVLDLSRTLLDYLPPTVDLLCELRYLNLSYTGISSLPTQLGKLTKLRQLDLRYTQNLRKIPAEAISGLKALQLLNMYGSGFPWLPSTNNNLVKSVNVKDLEPLENLTELGVTLGDMVPFCTLQKSTRLRRSVRFMKLSMMKDLISNSLSSALSTWSRLRELKLEECPQLEELIIDNNQLVFLQVLQLEHLSRLSTVQLGHADRGRGEANASSPLRRLSHLSISYCDVLKPIEWVGHLPHLEEIHVDHCKSMTQLLTGGLSGGGGGEELPRLRRLYLENLRRLTDISEGSSLRTASLEDVKVENCPMLPPASMLKSRLLHCE